MRKGVSALHFTNFRDLEHFFVRNNCMVIRMMVYGPVSAGDSIGRYK
mgnify:CR=1 FL=1